ncbi:hypothetical protein FE257_010924 [Aspergillus nanangensis]|uniref:Glycosyltransferase 2-like domain-containing protein n=1 Tax=Aspergillus nanangensis TaxID=2582783 RepID=A0AAD4CXP1_ASPNN|nr:hypothetical protein FE257_010924 [Aspergillus nanangensis]
MGFPRGNGQRHYLLGNTAPAIDVFITCCGEELDVILDTAAAAASLDYPQYRTFLLDDAKCPNVRRAIEELNLARKPGQGEVVYLSRDKVPGQPHYFKSGNIRFGLDTVANGGQYADFVAALDVDMIPERDWLRRLIPHLLLDKNVAMVVPPQRYYNTPIGDPLAQDSNVFALFGEPINDSLGSTACTGSGYILRRSTVEDIGGWPLAEAGEDILCSYLLTGYGWKIKFVAEDIQYGLLPASLASWFKQRARWTDGNLVIFHKLGWFLPRWDTAPMRSFPQRVVGLAHVLGTYMAIPYSILLLIGPWALYPVSEDLPTTSISSASHSSCWLHIVLLTATILKKLSTFRLYKDVGTKTAGKHRANRVWSAPRHKVGFAVTGTMVSTANERSPKHRKPFLTRIMHPTVLGYWVWILYAVVPLALRARSRIQAPTGSLVSLTPMAVYSLFVMCMVVIIPLQYMARPLNTLERRELMERDSAGLYRPGTHARKRSEPETSVGWKDLMELALILWAQ